MAVRLKEPRHGISAATTAGLLFVGIMAAPVLAAPERGLLCDDSAAPTLDVADSELTATLVNNSDELLRDHLLEPRAKSAARGAFADEVASEDTDSQELDAEEEPTAAKPGVRSASDPGQASFKRQMYRRDI